MKKKLIIFAVLISLVLSFAIFNGCQTESSTGPGSGGLVGTWITNLASFAMRITTGTAQTAKDFLAQGIGSIVLSGAQTGTLTYMAGFTNGVDLLVAAMNRSIYEILLGNTFPYYFLVLMDLPVQQAAIPKWAPSSSLQGDAILAGIPTAGDTVMYAGDMTNFTFDNTTLTANNAALLDPTLTQTVYANGTLANSLKNVPANTPTDVLTLNLLISNYGTLILNDDGTFTAMFVFDTEGDTAEGTWEDLGSNTLRFIAEVEVPTLPKTVAEAETLDIAYTLSGGSLTLIMQEDVVQMLLDEEMVASEEEALAIFEELFGLDAGSLNAVLAVINLSFTKSSSKQGTGFLAYNFKGERKPIQRLIVEKLVCDLIPPIRR